VTEEKASAATAPAAQALIGSKVQEMVDGTPEIMKELMQQFITQKDLNDRVRIRMRMKSILDLVSVDTVYPKTAAPRPRPNPYAAGPAPYMLPPAPGGLGDGGVVADPVEVPGAVPAPQNDDILGG